MWHSLCQICLFSTISYARVGAWHWQHLCLSQSVSVLINGKINGIERGSMYECSMYLASGCGNLSESICICLARCTLLPQLHPHLDTSNIITIQIQRQKQVVFWLSRSISATFSSTWAARLAGCLLVSWPMLEISEEKQKLSNRWWSECNFVPWKRWTILVDKDI